MTDHNNFPESSEKTHLRLTHLKYLARYKLELGRLLSYFGLPSAEMRDVKAWQPVLDRIVAVERDSDIAEAMYRSAQLSGIRPKTLILEMDLREATKVLAMKESDVNLFLSQYPISDQRNLMEARKSPFDVINLDLCGGFLFKKRDGTSDNVEILKNLISLQAHHKRGFLLILTFQLRDTGADDYQDFIVQTLTELQASTGINTAELQEWYAEGSGQDSPKLLRRLRFCIPLYLLKISLADFEIRSVGAWYYKTFYHTALRFQPREGRNVLGNSIWPPLDQVRALVNAPMLRLEVDENGQIQSHELEAPKLP